MGYNETWGSKPQAEQWKGAEGALDDHSARSASLLFSRLELPRPELMKIEKLIRVPGLIRARFADDARPPMKSAGTKLRPMNGAFPSEIVPKARFIGRCFVARALHARAGAG
jgi:hypothetical protein